MRSDSQVHCSHPPDVVVQTFRIGPGPAHKGRYSVHPFSLLYFGPVSNCSMGNQRPLPCVHDARNDNKNVRVQLRTIARTQFVRNHAGASLIVCNLDTKRSCDTKILIPSDLIDSVLFKCPRRRQKEQILLIASDTFITHLCPIEQLL